MKINVCNPGLGQQKTFTIEDENCLRPFYEKRMGADLPADSLGEQFKGYVVRITGGNDKQGFPMMQGVLKNNRVMILMKDGMPCYRSRRNGMRKRKSVRGCIVNHDLAIMNLAIVKKGEKDIEGLTDGTPTRRLGPKRASKIRKMFGLEKEDDVRQYVVRRTIGEEGSKKNKAPKIQRLVTKLSLQRKRSKRNTMVKKVAENRKERKAYADRIHEYRQQQKELRAAEVAKKKAKKAKKA